MLHGLLLPGLLDLGLLLLHLLPQMGKLNRPVLVWIHGGGWRQGDKSNVQHKPQAFVDQGFVFVSVNYRFVPHMYAAAFGQNEADRKILSPITHVAKDKDIPPFLILHVADRPDAASQSRAFAKALADAGISAKVFPGEGKTHATINRDLGLPKDEPTKTVFGFLNGLLEDR